MADGLAEERRVGNLPQETSRLVGRQAELAQVARLCGRSRLVTVTGVGGVGKTRLALAAAEAVQAQFRDGAWFVELSPLRDGELVALVIAEALPLADQTTRSVIDVVAEYLAERETLLVLDTCEHLAEACALTADVLLRAAPGLRILATSRRPLNLADEEVVVLDPLPVPEEGDLATGAEDAVALLAERATQAVPGFTVTDANRPDLVRLCRRLEGLPLAIELAAARLHELSISELAERLDDRFSVLGNDREAVPDADPPWHQALRTAIGWSNELCTPQERLLWARVSVFAGDFDAEAVRRVCADDRLPGEKIPALLSALADASILSWVPTGGGDRYRMLDTIREYGAFWLQAAGERDACRRRHVAHYTSLLRHFADRFLTSEQVPLYWALVPERENLRAALGYALDEGGGVGAVALTAVMWPYWTCAGQPREAGHWMDLALDRAPEPSADRFTTLVWSCTYATYRGEHAAAQQCADEAQEVADRLGDLRLAGYAAMSRGMALAYAGEPDAGLDLLRRATEIFRDVGDTSGMCLAAIRSCVAHTIAGDLDAALAAFAKARDLLGEGNEESYFTAFILISSGIAQVLSGDTTAAGQGGRRALELQFARDDLLGVASSLSLLAWVAAQEGRYARAACLFGAASAVLALAGAAPFVGNPKLGALHARFDATARQALGDQRYEVLHRQGAQWPRSVAVEFAVSDRDTPPTVGGQ
ncbi:ATP-binding protein [Streptomyces ochraceiscleroticus]|uniref:ATP-binding protein n=1 Tax=Streptomyces ochraceiscleroticus TaxID=47761 RepID=A0ABW1MSY9_9ACTN|nr:LuxR family transcriptional regulator [Streptomyces ochraceiscleroticus]